MSEQRGSESGFTLIEMLIAIVVLSIGVLGLLDGTATMTKMVRDSRQRTRAIAMATTRLESIRRLARTTSPNCSSLTNGSLSHSDGYSEVWTVSGSGFSRSVVVAVSFPNNRRTSNVTYRTSLLCQ